MGSSFAQTNSCLMSTASQVINIPVLERDKTMQLYGNFEGLPWISVVICALFRLVNVGTNILCIIYIIYIYPRHQPSYSQMLGVCKNDLCLDWCHIMTSISIPNQPTGFNRSTPRQFSLQANSIESWAIQSSWAS